MADGVDRGDLPLDPETVPYVVGSDDPTVHRIASQEWDPELVLPPGAHLL